MMAALLDHLWQSTVFAGVAGLLTLLLRGQGAALRHALWMAASVKFLLPFSLLTAAGRMLTPLAFPFPMPVLAGIKPAMRPFSMVVAPAQHLPGPGPSMTLWAAGSAALLLLWGLRWLKLRATLRDAADIALPMPPAVPVSVKATASYLEPGLVGIWRPVILLPQGIAQKLSAAELGAILAHELCHLRRRDNLTAAVHMLVEVLFWFHPLVWWIGGWLVEERERACDESVVAAGNAPLTYAQGILKVCRFYVQSPLACAAGVSGADLQLRLGAIMADAPRADLPPAKMLLLAAAGACALALPLAAGMEGAPAVTRIAVQVAAVLETPLVRVADVQAVAIAPPRPSAHIRHQKVAALDLSTAAPVVSAPMVQAVVPENPAPVTIIAPVAMPDVDPMVCRKPQQLPASRFLGPAVCLHQSEWATLQAHGKTVSPDGREVADLEPEKWRSISGQTCRPLSSSGGGATTANLINFSPFCF